MTHGLFLAFALLGLTLAAKGESVFPTQSPSVSFDAAAQAAADLPRLHSLLVSHRGTMVLERYFNGARATRPANVKSVSKSIISALVGIAIERQHIAGINQPIGAYFAAVLRAPADEPKRAVTIEHLLTMRSGLESTSSRNYGAWVTSKNWVRYALTRDLEFEPGTEMEYSTGNSHLLSAILTQSTKTSTWQFAQDVLARPLGFTLSRWPRDPQGIYFGGNDMLLTPRQMLLFGELYLNRGQKDGVQVIPSRWIEDSWIPRGRSDYSDQMYGYGWWIRELAGHPAFYAWGFGGQYIFVVPTQQLVVVTTSSTAVGEERRSHRRTIVDLVERFIIAPIAALNSPQA